MMYNAFMDKKIELVLSKLKQKGFLFPKLLPNTNNRPETYYFLCQTRDRQDVLVKISINVGRNYRSSAKMLKKLERLKIGSPKVYFSGNMKGTQVIIRTYVKGKSIQKAGYQPIKTSLHNSLIKFVVEHFHKMQQVKTKGLELSLSKKGESLFLGKLALYVERLSQNDLSIIEPIKNLLNDANKNFRLSPPEFAIQHGDFYGSNILFDTETNLFKLIDWDSAMFTSQYFDISTFVAKELNSSDVVTLVYNAIYSGLSSQQRKNLNYQILIALIKEYKNLDVLSGDTAEIPVLKNYKQILKNTLSKNLMQYSSQLSFGVGT